VSEVRTFHTMESGTFCDNKTLQMTYQVHVPASVPGGIVLVVDDNSAVGCNVPQCPQLSA